MGLRPFFPPASAALALAFALATGAAACHDVGLYPLQARPTDAGSELVDVGVPMDADGPSDDGATDLGTDTTTVPPICPDPAVVGFASLTSAGVDGGPPQVGTTGGGSLAPIPVTSLEAFMTLATDPQPHVILVMGRIKFPALPDGGTDGLQVRIMTSNKTIVGDGADSGFSGGGLFLDGARNIIIRNIKISGAFHTDAITVQNSSNVWIDHCDLSCDPVQTKACDGLVDITHASDFITVSWTHYHDHDASGLVGGSDNNGAEDMNHLTVTYHHNLFSDVTTGPRLRFGQIHLFNVYFVRITDYAIGSTCNAQGYIEGCVFDSTVKTPITTMVSTSPAGFVAEGTTVADYYVPPLSPGANNIGTIPATFRPQYQWSAVLDSISTTQAIVPLCAGTGNVTPLPIPTP